ncbi:hypothetical protein ABW19_dt0201209 [Dactylella cylindrospora]|nr:hypothetical protein ABW19_dt0201209 [Dactylella cylindrospora]
MCNGHSNRTSQGGAIAILRGQGQRTGALVNARITLHNLEDDDSTRATFHLDKTSKIPSLNSCSLIIHQDGDLNCNDPSQEPLYQLPVDIYGAEAEECEIFLTSKLDLGVGGRGVIGRKMSLMNSRQVIAQGIIGWN